MTPQSGDKTDPETDLQLIFYKLNKYKVVINGMPILNFSKKSVEIGWAIGSDF